MSNRIINMNEIEDQKQIEDIRQAQKQFAERSNNFEKNIENIVDFNNYWKKIKEEYGYDRPLLRLLIGQKDLYRPGKLIKNHPIYGTDIVREDDICCVEDVEKTLISIKEDIEYILKIREENK